jgi:hypothetical protein
LNIHEIAGRGSGTHNLGLPAGARCSYGHSPTWSGAREAHEGARLMLVMGCRAAGLDASPVRSETGEGRGSQAKHQGATALPYRECELPACEVTFVYHAAIIAIKKRSSMSGVSRPHLIASQCEFIAATYRSSAARKLKSAFGASCPFLRVPAGSAN